MGSGNRHKIAAGFRHGDVENGFAIFYAFENELQRERSFPRTGFSFEEIEMSLWQAATENIIEAGAPRADTTRDWHLLRRDLCLWLFLHIQEVRFLSVGIA